MLNTGRVVGIVPLAILVGSLPRTALSQWRAVVLHPPGATSSEARGVNHCQQVGAVWFGDRYRAVMWSGSSSTWMPLTPFGGTDDSNANATALGVQAGSRYRNGWKAAVWNGSADSLQELYQVSPGGSEAYGTDGERHVGVTFFPDTSEVHAFLWTPASAEATDLHPSGSDDSRAFAVRDGQQVGYARILPDRNDHAALWRGSRASWIDLNPAWADLSRATGVGAGQQVGWARQHGHANRAMLWRGSSETWIDLTPEGAVYGAIASATDGVLQVGWVGFESDPEGPHAVVWAGAPEAYTDLHLLVPSRYYGTYATGVSHDGDSIYVSGYGISSETGRNQAILWIWSPPCAADFNGDGFLDFFDYDAFVEAFEHGDDRTDVNRDCFVDFFDYDAFVEAFEMGC